MDWSDRIGRRVRLRDLHIFLAVARSGSMAKAAEHLSVSQPVVSKTIAELEHALGVRLLDRTFRGVEPTAYGNAVISCGTVVFDELRRGVQIIELLADPTKGEIRVGATAPLMEGLIPAAFARLAVLCPGIAYRAMEGDSATLSRLLREREIDLAVSRSWGDHYGDDFATEFLFDESLFVVAGLGRAWNRNRKMRLVDLLGERWILPEPDNVAGILIHNGFKRAGMALPAALIVSNSMAIRTRLVEDGPFLTMLPGSMLHFGKHRLRLKTLPVALALESQPVEIITLKNRTMNPTAGLLFGELRTLVKPLVDGSCKDARTSIQKD